MSVRTRLSACLFLLAAAPVLAGPPCLDRLCGADDRPAACPPAYRHPRLYKCDVEVGTEPVEKTCNVIEQDVICVPPITTTPLDGLKSLFSRKARRAAAAGCGTAGCDGTGRCGSARCGVKKAGWFSRLTRGGCSGIKCVESVGTREYECGERCTYEWSAVRVDACGRPIVEKADEQPEAGADGEADSERTGPGEAPPPAPTPDFGTDADADAPANAADAPAEEVPGADADDAGESPVPPKDGVAGQAIRIEG